ncbi:hypothetical protein G7Y89_g14823 [Cudoniella acicularis]|uniref:FAD-binding PCMH-type domain-containing protein n=1 Tax=Cudoniella acicularis TaxID=354080 RepID=A0A8H4QWX1_9HELO|nr:hypothetical protein G7Y89_g14823 [Cudoniella acicularis]
MATINNIVGTQFAIGTLEYNDGKDQYATSSYPATPQEVRMEPALIVYAADRDDISKTLIYAKERGIAVAIRTGGHQYSGASSTVAPNIQLDLSTTFRKLPDDRSFFEIGGKGFVRTSVSWELLEFSKFLQDNHCFVPHGQCATVHLGGHVQSGGYGQLGRSFGLLADQVISLEVVLHDGTFKEVTKERDPDLFFGILGGSPGNFAVITHFTTKVFLDTDYPGARGLKSIYWYEKSTLQRLLGILAAMSDNEDFPRNYDYCVSILSERADLFGYFPGIEDQVKAAHPHIFGPDGEAIWPKMIVVYAQWVPFSPADKYDQTVQNWFESIRKGALLDPEVVQDPMSIMAGRWLFNNRREFDLPYVKSTRLSDSKTLTKDGWVDWIAGRIENIIDTENGLSLSAQIQPFGGKNSQFFQNRDNGTAHSFRNSTVCATLDAFYKDGHKAAAETWHNTNALEGVGPKGFFSKTDRRVLWGSFDNYDLDAVWNLYYDDLAKYERLRKIRKAADPHGVLTPNTFSVKRAA